MDRITRVVKQLRRVSRHRVTAGMEIAACAAVVVGVAQFSGRVAWIVGGLLGFGLAQLLDIGGEGRQ